MSSAKEINGTNSVDVLYSDFGMSDFVKDGESIYYYSKNSIKSEDSGIFKVDASNSNEEPIVTKIFTGKTDSLSIYGGSLYFANGNDNDYLYKLNLSTNFTSLVMEEKVHEYLISGNKLYATVNKLANDYIGCLDLSSSKTEPNKLIDYAGEFLTAKNGYLYFNCTDWISYLDPSVKGIWRIDLSGGSSEQLIKSNSISGFDVDSSGNLFYIDENDLHLYRYSVSSKAKTDLLYDFVAPETTPSNLGGQTISLKLKRIIWICMPTRLYGFMTKSIKKSPN